MDYIFAADIGGTACKLGLFTASDHNLLRKWKIRTDTSNNGDNILGDIYASIMKCAKDEGIDRSDILGVGLGIPGSVDEDGVVNKCINLGWGIRDIGKEFIEISGISNVKVANDANLAALGEAKAGSGIGYDSLVMITLGTGVGGGIVYKGRLVVGHSGAAGEVGHIIVNPRESAVCSCGNKGCISLYASATGFVRVANEFIDDYKGVSSLRRLDNINAKHIFDGAKAGDELANRIVDYSCNYLGQAIATICNVVNPSAVIIGGGVSGAGDIIIDRLRQGFDKSIFHAARDVDIRLAELGNDAGIYGAAYLMA